MIDFVKIRVNHIDIQRLYELPELDFQTQISTKNGSRATGKDVAKYHFCTITIFESGFVKFMGSIHKMYNSLHNINAPNKNAFQEYKGFNGNQFEVEQIFEVIDHLRLLFDCRKKDLVFQNIEFGFNLQTNFLPQNFIKGLLYHKNKPFEFRHSNHYAQLKHQRYFIKIYNKSKQYRMNQHTLRVEIKLITADQFKPLGIKTLANINAVTLQNAKNLLLKRFEEVFYYDITIRTENLRSTERNALIKYKHPLYWVDELSKQKRYLHGIRLQNFIFRNSDEMKNQIIELIERKGLPITND